MTEKPSFSSVYLLTGSEEWLLAQAVARLERNVGVSTFDRLSVQAGDMSIADILDFVRTPSLTSPRRIAVLQAAQTLPAEERDVLMTYCEAPVQTGILILVADVDKLPAWLKHAPEAVKTVACRPLAEGPASAWLQDRVKKASDKTLTRDAATALVDRVGTSLRPLVQALDQVLSSVGKRPTVERADVEAVVGISVSEETFAMTRVLAKGRVGDALVRLNRLLDQGVEPEQLLGMLRWHCDKMRSDPRGFYVLLGADLSLKRGRGNARVILESLVIRLAGLSGHFQSLAASHSLSAHPGTRGF